MRGTKITAILAAASLVLAAASSARAQSGWGGHNSWGGGGGGADAAQIAGGVLGIIGGALGGNTANNSNGWGHLSGSQNNFGNNWLNTTPKYRWKNVPQYEMKRVYHPGPAGEDGFGQYKIERVQTGTKRVRVQEGYKLTPNVGNILSDIPKFIPPPTPRRYHNDWNYVSPPSNSVRRTTVVPNRPPAAPKEADPPELTLTEPTPPTTNPPPKPNEDPSNFADLSDPQRTALEEQLAEAEGTVNEDIDNTLESAMVDYLGDDTPYNDAIADFQQALKDGATGEELEEKYDKVREVGFAEINRQEKLGNPEHGVEMVQESLKQMEEAKKLIHQRDWIRLVSEKLNGSSSSLEGLLTGMVNVWVYPDLPAETIYYLDDGNVLAGTGGIGCMSSYETDAASLYGHEVIPGDPVPDTDADETPVVAGSLIMNPAETEATVHYTLNGHAFSIQPGYVQKLDADHAWTIEFDRSGSLGTARYTLEQGSYVFTANEEGGWDLRKRTFNVTVDNTENDNGFNYNADNQPTAVAAKRTRQHTSDYPILIEFDRGDGGEPARKKLKSGTFKIGVSAKTGLWDLFPNDATALAGGAGAEPKPPMPTPSLLTTQ